MVRRFDINNPDPVNRDERLGEAIEQYLALSEDGAPPDVEDFSARFPELGDDLREALEGLALVRGLVGDASGPGHRLESGRRVAGYRIVRELGRGGMGIVYEAVHVGLDRPVALKVLGTHAAPDSNGRRRFLNEARTAAGLHHTHIVPVFDVGQVGGLCYYAMQRIEGSGLDRVLRSLRLERSTAAGSGSHGKSPTPGGNKTERAKSAAPSLGLGGMSETGTWNGAAPGTAIATRDIDPLTVGPVALERDDEPSPFTPPRGSAYYRWVAQVGRQAAEALGHAHHRGIIHRDVKPSNILIDARGTIWMADFGLARRLADPGLTQSDSLLGTPRYMSPEQAEPGPIDGRTDVYSLGATLFELLTLRPPFEGNSAAELVRQIVNREPAHPRTFDSRIPRDLETIVLKALAKRPADRYPTATDLAADLERFLNYEPVKARRISPFGRSWRFARRHPALTAVSLIASAIILSVATNAHVRVLHARDQALIWGKEKEQALTQFRNSERQNKPLQVNRWISLATNIRQTPGIDRVRPGLDMIRNAAKLDPDDAWKVRLRDEAIEFLALRDVVPEPSLETGPTRAIAFSGIPSGRASRLAALSESGNTLSIWDVASRELVAKQDLRVSPAPFAAESDDATTSPSGPRRGPGDVRFADRLTACFGWVAVVRPANPGGFRLIPVNDPLAAVDYTLPGLDAPGRELTAIHLISREEPKPFVHLVTVERLRAKDDPRPGSFRFAVRLWDLREFCREKGSPARPPKTLDEGSVDRESGPGPRSPLISISPDGSTIALAQRANAPSVTFWDAKTGAPKGTLSKMNDQPILALALGPDGLLAIAQPGTVRVWDIDAESGPIALPAFTPRHYWVGSIRFSPDGGVLAISGPPDPGIELWDVVSSTLVATLPTADRVDTFAFSPGGQTIAAPSTRAEAASTRQDDPSIPRRDHPESSRRPAAVALWSIVDPVGRVRLPDSKARPTALGFGPEDTLAIASWDGPVRLWSPDFCPLTAFTLGGKDNRPINVAFDAQGRLLTLDSGGLKRLELGSTRDGRHCAADAPTPPYLAELPPLTDSGLPGVSKPLPAVLASASAARRMVLTRLQDVFLVDPDAAEPVRKLEPPERDRGRTRQPSAGAPWRNVALAPKGNRIYLASYRDDLQVWSLDGDRVKAGLWASRLHDVTAMALSPDGKTLALGDRAGAVSFVDPDSGRVIETISPSNNSVADRVDSLAFSLAGDLLAIGGFEQVRLHRLGLKSNAVPLLRLPVRRGRVVLLAFNRQGLRLAVATDANSIDVWDLARVREDLDNLKLGW